MFYTIFFAVILIIAASLHSVSAAAAGGKQQPLKSALSPSKPKILPLGRDHRVHRETGKIPRLTHAQQHRRLQKRFGAESGTAAPGAGRNIPMDGDIWPVSIFWTTVQVGTPQVSYPVAVDSGSNALFMSGEKCIGCQTKKPNVPYIPSQSSSSMPLGTNFSFTYETCVPWNGTESCTITGQYYADVVSLADYAPAVPIKTGTIEYMTPNFYQFNTISGIMGFTTTRWIPGNPSTDDTRTVFEQLCEVHSEETGCEPVWAICMHEGSVSNGTLTIGGVDTRFAKDGKIGYVPDPYPERGYYSNDVFGFVVGNVSVDIGKGPQNAILDTGTNSLLLLAPMFRQTQKIMCANKSLAHCDAFFNDPTACFALTEEQIAAYPPLELKLANGVTLRVTGRDYLLLSSPMAKSSDEYCFGIGSGGDEFFIIGDVIMQQQYLVFDFRNGNARIGWGEVNDAMCGSV